jgi:hypothetical protein
MTDDEDTERVWPPPEHSSVVEKPIPIGPSIRTEFLAHRRHIDGRLNSFQLELSRALERLAPERSPSSVARKVGHSALVGGKYAAVVLAALGLLQGAVQLWRPELAGPFEDLLKLLGGP